MSHEGIHSGTSGGSIPSSFRIARKILDRVEDSGTGEVLVPEMHVEITQDLKEKAESLAAVVGESLWKQLPTVDSLTPVSPRVSDMILGMNWQPSMCVIGADGLPSVQVAGNVLRTNTDLKLSFRIPPGVEAESLEPILKELLSQTRLTEQRSPSSQTPPPMVFTPPH